MARTDLSIPQRAALLTLMVAGREVPNPELEKEFGVRLERAQRQQLVDLGYVAVTSGPRGSKVLELTDGGWRACHDQLTAGAPPRAMALGNTLYTLLGGLARYFDHTGMRLADVFGQLAQPAGATAVGAVGTDVDEGIRQAYRKLVTRPGGWVGLAALRRELRGVPDGDVDDALRALFRAQAVNLVPESNQKALTDEDRRAALHVGGEDKHLVSIEDA